MLPAVEDYLFISVDINREIEYGDDIKTWLKILLSDFSCIVGRSNSVVVFNPTNACMILLIISSILSTVLSTFCFRLLICWESLLLSDEIEVAIRVAARIVARAGKILVFCH